MTTLHRSPRGTRIEAALDGARVAWSLLPAGAGTLEDPAAHHVAVHVGPPHRLWESRDGARRAGPHRRGHVVITAAGERATLRWDRPTTFVDVALERALLEDLPLRGRAPTAIRGAFAHDEPRLRDLAIALARRALGRDRDALALELEALVLETGARLAARAGGVPVAEPRGGLAPARLRRVLDRIHDTLDERHSLAELAGLAGTSRFHFARQFRHTTGISPHAYVVEARVNEAARLLLAGVDVEEVAFRVGMFGRGHLARHLGARLGVTPASLRPRVRRPDGTLTPLDVNP